jgi:hypothetical protein
MHGARPAAGVNRWWVRTSRRVLSSFRIKKIVFFFLFDVFQYCLHYTTRNNVRSHVFFSIVSARAQTRLFRLLFVFERRVVFWQEHQHHSQRDDQNDANKKGDDDAHQNRSGIIIIIIAAIERRLKNAKNKVKLDSKRAAPNDEKTTVSGKREEGGGRPSTFFDDLGMKRSFPTPGANGMLSMWEGDPDGWEKMDPLKKLWVVWSGEKGVMYWMNQGSLYGAGFIAFCWVCFRFVGPILGLYELK